MYSTSSILMSKLMKTSREFSGATAPPGRSSVGEFEGPHRDAPRVPRGAANVGEFEGPSRGPSTNGRPVADERGAAHVARLVRREGPGTVHRATVVPHHQVADPPIVGVDALPLGGVL